MSGYNFLKASDGTGNAVLAHVTIVRLVAATVLKVDSVSKWPTGGFIATVGTLDGTGFLTPASITEFTGHIVAGDIIIDGFEPGFSDLGNAVGQVVVIKQTTGWANSMVNNAKVEHNDDGTHNNITANSVKLNDGTDLSNQGLYQQAIINSGCLIAQRQVPTLSTAYQYGRVDRFAAKCTGTVLSAGTIDQNTTALVAATKGYEIKIAGVTVTGAGIVFLRYRMEAKDALMFINAAASFGVKIHQNTGGAINATVFINKATVADNFTATTAIANSGAISIPNAASTQVKFENINAGNLGDVSNGIEIEIQIACGAVTAKNFSFGEFQFNKGAKVQPFQPKTFSTEIDDCQRYYEKSYDLVTTPGTATAIGAVTLPSNSNVAGVETTGIISFATRKRTSPAFGFWDTLGNASKVNSNAAITGGAFSTNPNNIGVDVLAAGASRYSFQWAVDAEL